MKLLNEHWNGFRSSQSLVDAYKTLYRSLGLQIKIVASCSHSATGLCRCLASGGAWSSPEHPPADPFPRQTGLHQALLSCLGVLLTSRAEPELSPSPESSVSPEGFSPSRFCLNSGGCTINIRTWFRKQLVWIGIPAWERYFQHWSLCLTKRSLFLNCPCVAELPVKVVADPVVTELPAQHLCVTVWVSLTLWLRAVLDCHSLHQCLKHSGGFSFPLLL